jgi:hypothetical protein
MPEKTSSVGQGITTDKFNQTKYLKTVDAICI